MDECSGGMKNREAHERMRQNFMYLLHATGEGTILEPWRRDLRQAKHRKRIASRELKHNADDRHGYQQEV